MKTLTSLLIAASLSGAAVSYAGPGPQFWNRPATKPAKPAEASQPATQSDNARLTCARILVPNNGAGFSKAPLMSVRCTPAMMKNNPQRQQACAQAAKG